MSAPKITLNQQTISCEPGQSLLDAMLRANVDIPHGCRQGICQSCMLLSLNDAPPPEAQHGLKELLRQQNRFLACLCYPKQDMSVDFGSTSDLFATAKVIGKRALNDETLLLTLHCDQAMNFYAGQFVNLKRADGLTRSYSIANSRIHANRLSFHIRRLAGGRFSEWVHRELRIGDDIDVSDPQGECYYQPGNPDQNMLLIGTGSGLAPLAGIVEEALHHGHRGEIRLYHGSREVTGLYWVEEMRQLADRYPNFNYTPCVSRGDSPPGFAQGRANEVAMKAHVDLKHWRVYLCGHPEMVNQSKRQAYLLGCGLSDIHSDAFHVASPTLD